jgi:hypothetical protein
MLIFYFTVCSYVSIFISMFICLIASSFFPAIFIHLNISTCVLSSFLPFLFTKSYLFSSTVFRFPQFVPTALSQLIPNASQEGLVMMQVMALWAHQSTTNYVLFLILSLMFSVLYLYLF